MSVPDALDTWLAGDAKLGVLEADRGSVSCALVAQQSTASAELAHEPRKPNSKHVSKHEAKERKKFKRQQLELLGMQEPKTSEAVTVVNWNRQIASAVAAKLKKKSCRSVAEKSSCPAEPPKGVKVSVSSGEDASALSVGV